MQIRPIIIKDMLQTLQVQRMVRNKLLLQQHWKLQLLQQPEILQGIVSLRTGISLPDPRAIAWMWARIILPPFLQGLAIKQ